MSEIEVNSPEISSANNGRRSSAIFFWGEPNTPEADDVPKQLFLSSAINGNVPSTSSNLNKVRRKKRKKKLSSEVDNTPLSENKSKISIISETKDAFSSVSYSHETVTTDSSSSTDSEGVFCTKRELEKFADVKSISKLKTNKVHDFNSQIDSNKSKTNDSNQSKMLLEVPKTRFDRRSSAGGSSIDTEFKKSITSVSELSYKDKIRDRFHMVKEKTVESLSRPSSRLKSNFTKKRRPKIDDILKQEEFELNTALKRHEEIKLRWQKASKTSLGLSSEEKSLNQEKEEAIFFFEDEPEEITNSQILSAATVHLEEKSSAEDQGESKMLTSELLDLKDEWDLVEFVKPEKANMKNEKLWREKLFYPSTKPVSLESKLEPGLTPRFLEEEGIYVGKKIKISKAWKNKFERRILQTPEGRKWFTGDGEPISSHCPLKTVTTRPCYDDDGDAFSSNYLEWVPATLGDLSYRYIDISGNSNYVLDIDINSVEFTHHPLFSKEHMLAQSLKELYIKYKRRKEMDSLNRLNERLGALRKTRDNLKNIILQGGDNESLKDELQAFENDIKEVREMRYAEGKIDKQLKNKILITWKDLLKLRENQGYQTTFIKLNFKKKMFELGEKELKAKWEADLKEEISEVIDEMKKEYKKALGEYKLMCEVSSRDKKQTRKYEVKKGVDNFVAGFSGQKNVNGLDSIKKEEEEKSNVKEDNEDEDNDEDDDDDENDEDEDESEKDMKAKKKLKPPKSFNSSEIKARITEKFKISFFGPGESDFEFFMTKDERTDVSSTNSKEEMRKAAVKKNMIFIKLYYNGKEICKSKCYPLGQIFKVKIGERFAVRILEWPESLMLEIHEETGNLSKNNILVSGIYLPFPDAFSTVQNSEITKYEFSSETSVVYLHAAVGSGNEIVPCPDGSDLNNQPIRPYISGFIACRIGWMDDNGKILAPKEKYWNVLRNESTINFSEILLYGGAFDLAKLKKWAEKSKLDPNDPYNSAFFNFLESAGDFETIKPAHFRLNPLLDDFDFCEEKDIENNQRLKLLRLRQAGEPGFSEAKMVPLNEKQIHKEIFKDYEKRTSMQFSLCKVDSADPIESHRISGKKYMEQIQQMLLKKCLMAKNSRRYQDIIAEETVPDIRTLGLTFMKWLQPKRRLRPIRKERKKVAPQNYSGQEIKIIVNVVRAFEVPVRKDVDGKSANGSIDGFSLVNVRPFVEISFQGVTARTNAAEGANPTWNQDLQIFISNKNGHSLGNFPFITGTLYLHLFDEIVIDLIEDESTRETNIHQRLERHWLASMEIPFSTLYFNSRVEGTFKLYSPPILLGYEKETHRLHFAGSTNQERLLPQRDGTYITLFVTVQPALNPPKHIKEKMECSENINLEKHLEEWVMDVTNLFPHRKVTALVLDITGKSVCVTRFVKPLPLPFAEAEEDEIITPDLIARFVAMIPLVPKSAVSPGYFDIWLNAEQMFKLLLGDAEDHAILLCCYFLKLGLEAYVLLGSGIPHGFTAYVLVIEKMKKSTGKHYVWDPTNGQKYSVDDSFCPLQKVYSLINDQNIWANIQAEEVPRRIRFDLSKRGDWFPVFGKNISAPSKSVQPQSINYIKTSEQAVDFLQDKIEKKLRDDLMKWRKGRRTPWNRYCAATLRKLLPGLEKSSYNIETHTPDHTQELQHILSSHKICGFPINLAYTKIDAITEAVKATGVHSNESEGVEFALAVYVHPYPNNVLSVWIYVASLIKRR